MTFWDGLSVVIAATGLISISIGLGWWVRRLGWLGWWELEHGRFMMLLSGSLFGIFVLILTRPFAPGGWRQVFAIIVYLGLLALTFWLPRLVWISFERERENDMGFMTRVKRFFLRREPALWLATLQAVLAAIVGFKFDWLSAEQAALWVSFMNVVLGAVMAWRTRPVAPSLFTTALSVAVTLMSAYGLHVSQEMVGAVNMLIFALVALLTRAQVSPEEDASRTGVLGNKPAATIRA
jgi:hypothetical protein